MKYLLIGLMALMFTLGVSCKKENQNTGKTQTEVKKTDEHVHTVGKEIVADAPIDEGYGGYPGGQYVYPHSTGLCYCGQYSVCHPAPPIVHKDWCCIFKNDGHGCTCQLNQ